MGNGHFRSELNPKTRGTFSSPVSVDDVPEEYSRTYRCKLTYEDGTTREALFSLLKRDSRIVGRTAALSVGEAISFSLDGIHASAWRGVYCSLNPIDVGRLRIGN